MPNYRTNPGDGPRKILSAAAHNRQVEAGEESAANRSGAKLPTKALPVRTNWCVQQIENQTGSERRRWEVVQIGDLILSQLDEYWPSFGGITPTDPDCRAFAILQQPLADGDIDPIARVDGWSTALVVIAEQCHQWAQVVEGSHVLQSAECGQFKILWKPAGVGEQVCVVLFRGEKCETGPQWVRADSCIFPGTTYGTARRQKKTVDGYVDDERYAPVVIDNSECLVMALPGELFRAEPCGSGGTCCDSGDGSGGDSGVFCPSAEHGLTRRVRIDDCIGCGATGTAVILQSICAGCESVEALCEDEPATIEVCNTSGRPVAPCGSEDAVAHLGPKSATPGGGSGSGDETRDCCWWIQAGPYPTRARGELKAELCPDGTATVENVTFPGFCGEWEKPTTAKNPYGLPGCSGAVVELAMTFTGGESGCSCEWEVVIVKPKIVGQLVQDIAISCEDTSCTLDTKTYRNVAMWSCDSTVCSDTPQVAVAATGQYVQLVDDVSVDCAEGDGCGGIRKSYTKVCVFCTQTVDDVVIPFTSKTFVTDVTREDGGCTEGGAACSLKKKAVTVCGLFCTTGESDSVAFSFQGVDVYGPPSGDACDCDGMYLGRRTILAPCVCDPQADEKILSFSAQDVITGFVSPTGSNWDECDLKANWAKLLVIDCGNCVPDGATSGETTILEGRELSVVTEVVCGDCIETVVTGIKVLCVGGDYQVAATDCTCSTECPPTGSGSA